MEKKEEIPFFITGIVFMLLIAGIKYAVGSQISLISLLVTFVFGGVVGLLAVSPKDSFVKNLVFIAAFAWVIWAMLNPIKVVGDNMVISSWGLLAVITFLVIFIERDILNSFNRMRHKPATFALGFFGLLLAMILVTSSTVGKAFSIWMAENWLVGLILTLVWLVIVYFIASKNIKKMGGNLFKTINKIGGKR